jgi:hypothetical protein
VSPAVSSPTRSRSSATVTACVFKSLSIHDSVPGKSRLYKGNLAVNQGEEITAT